MNENVGRCLRCRRDERIFAKRVKLIFDAFKDMSNSTTSRVISISPLSLVLSTPRFSYTLIKTNVSPNIDEPIIHQTNLCPKNFNDRQLTQLLACVMLDWCEKKRLDDPEGLHKSAYFGIAEATGIYTTLSSRTLYLGIGVSSAHARRDARWSATNLIPGQVWLGSKLTHSTRVVDQVRS